VLGIWIAFLVHLTKKVYLVGDRQPNKYTRIQCS
jgi:hypothetical protein